MKDQKLTDEEILTRVSSMSLDELEGDNEIYEQAQTNHEKHRLPLYVIVGVAFVIGTINGLYFGSGAVFLMCLVFGGGTLGYLWFTRHDDPTLHT